MKTHFAKIFVLSLVLGLGLILGIAYGQPVAKVIAQEIGSLGLADPPPTNYQTLYAFAGVKNDNTSNVEIATSVHCTNYGTGNVDIKVEFFDTTGSTGYLAQQTLTPNHTWTFSTQETSIYHSETNASAGDIDQGSGRVTATGITIICTAQVFDDSSSVPEFMTALDLYLYKNCK